MVSKSKILGKSPLIFVTIGTTDFQFNRLFCAIDKAMHRLKSNPRLVAQMGKSNYNWEYKNIIQYDFLSPKQMRYYLSRANRIITHCGYGTLQKIALKAKCCPLVVARLKKYQEHVNDHQLVFCNYLKKKTPDVAQNIIIDDTSLDIAISSYLASKNTNMPSYVNWFASSPKRVIRHLQNFINS